MMDSLEVVARILVAGLLGALVGFERESTGHAAGVRTHALVALGASLFTVVGSEAFGPEADGSRVAAQVVTGIGFVGAGTIIRNGMSVRGLTTAAMLWVSGALGVATGAGAYVAAGVGGAAVLAFVTGLQYLKPVLTRGSGFCLVVEYEVGHGTLGPLLRGLDEVGAKVIDLEIRDDESMRHVEISTIADHARLEEFATQVARRPEVYRTNMKPTHEA